MSNQAESLWRLVYATLNPKGSDATPNACLNRLISERVALTSPINEETAQVRMESWEQGDLAALELKHRRTNELDDSAL